MRTWPQQGANAHWLGQELLPMLFHFNHDDLPSLLRMLPSQWQSQTLHGQRRSRSMQCHVTFLVKGILTTHDSLSLSCVFLRFLLRLVRTAQIKTQARMWLFGTNMSSSLDYWVYIYIYTLILGGRFFVWKSLSCVASNLSQGCQVCTQH